MSNRYEYPPGGGGVSPVSAGPRVQSGLWRLPEVSFSNQTPPLNRLWFVPVYLHRAQAWDGVGVQVITGAVGGTVRMGLYADNDGYPGDLIVDAGSVAASTNGVTITAAIDEDLGTGLYWPAAVVQGAQITVPCGSNASLQGILAYQNHTGPLGASSTWFRTGYRTDSVSGALPAAAPEGMSWDRYPILPGLRAA